ncbi:DUF167 family protein [Polycladidibacter stylochi]|uniref:DUF167 family protein n=1 Tax=Polycladidibacter stylochi TaxID=1807766 RepID=UPI00083402EC|nr:DUF167 family protein [Pseudovibrio stylochi]
MTSIERPWQVTSSGLKLTVRLTPKASKDQIESIGFQADGKAFIQARVRALPEKNAANKALVIVLAKKLGLSKSAIEITSGATSCLKTISITCNTHTARDVLQQLEAL